MFSLVSAYYIFVIEIQCQHTMMDVNIPCVCMIPAYHIFNNRNSISTYHIGCQYTMFSLMSAYHLFNIEIKCQDTMLYHVGCQHTIFGFMLAYPLNVIIPCLVNSIDKLFYHIRLQHTKFK